jgi:hypothetical protein
MKYFAVLGLCIPMAVLCIPMAVGNITEVSRAELDSGWTKSKLWIREISVNGHTYIVTSDGNAICPSAETLMWAYSQRTTAPCQNGVE